MTQTSSDTAHQDDGQANPAANTLHFLHPDLVRLDQNISSRKRLFQEISQTVAQYCENTGGPSLTPETILETLHERERLGCTGVGDGIALPHARLAQVSQPIITMIRLAQPIDYDAPDGKPVWFAVCLLVSENANQEHLNILAYLAGLLNREDFVEQVKLARSPEELYSLFTGQEA